MEQHGLQIRQGKKGGPFEGCQLVQPGNGQKYLRMTLDHVGARMRGTGYILPKEAGPDVIARLHAAARIDADRLNGKTSESEYRATCSVLEIQMMIRRAPASLMARARAAARKQIEDMPPEERKHFTALMTRAKAGAALAA